MIASGLGGTSTANNKKGKDLSKTKRIIFAICAVLLLVVAMIASQAAFKQVLNFRTLERIPPTQVLTSTGGEVLLMGRVQPAEKRLSSPDTQSPSVYYRYLVEEEYRDGDGNKKWRKVREERQAANFYLQDDSGRALITVEDAIARIDWSIPRKFREERGDYRYSEWRIDLGDVVTLYAWLSISDSDPVATFTTRGDYLPIITNQSAVEQRGKMGWSAVLLLACAITALTFMAFFLVCSLAVHRVLTLLAIITVSNSVMLLYYGWRSLEHDVDSGYARVLTQYQRSTDLIEKRLQTLAIDDVDIAHFDLATAQFSRLSQRDKAQINGWRLAAVMVRERYLQQIKQFPENLFASSLGMTNPIGFSLPGDQQQIAADAVGSFQATKISQQILLTLAALLVMGVLAWVAFRFIRLKRILENLPTTKTSGVVYGLTEVCGKLIPEQTEQLLTGPLSGQQCTWFNYVVKERRGSGKNTHWVTIEKDLQKQAFYCEDETGRLRVFPNKAEVITKHLTTKRRGKRRYYEWRLMPDDPLYLLGKADVDKTHGDTLVLRDSKDNPFIISNRSEQEVMFNKAGKGMVLLSAAVSIMFFALLLIAASSGSFTSLDYILTTLAAPMFFILLMIVITYNDLVFLKTRCQRAWANIQVSLKKRYDLIPRLVNVVKGYADHEVTLQESLTQLRTQSRQSDSVAKVERYIAAEHSLIAQLQVTVENYPELKADQTFKMLHKSLVKLENEVAMIRVGFNDAVEYYNTRIQQFPDTMLAKLGRFKRLTLLEFEQTVYEVPSGV